MLLSQESHMECLSFCVAEKIDLVECEARFREIPFFTVSKKPWQGLIIFNSKNHSSCFIFVNGTVVTWGLKRHQLDVYFSTIQPCCKHPLAKPISDEFSYNIGAKNAVEPHEYFNVDCLTLDSQDPELKLSLSYGFSQSIKLQSYEDKLDSLITKHAPLISEVSQTGGLHISRNKIRRIIGELLRAKSELNLTYNFLYKPKFFWKHPNLEEYFNILELYLDIPKRAHVINQRLNTLNQIIMMCNTSLETKHTQLLETIIIGLITVEIILNIFGLHIKF